MPLYMKSELESFNWSETQLTLHCIRHVNTKVSNKDRRIDKYIYSHLTWDLNKKRIFSNLLI